MTATPLAKLPEAAYSPIGSEVYRGLTAWPKTLSPWLFYDAAGSRLFEAITELPEYYLTRLERNIFSAYAAQIVARAAGGERLEILELGAGAATKTGLLLRAAIRMQGEVTYHAIDVSRSALDDAKTRLEAELPGVTVEPRVADYTVEIKEIGDRLSNGYNRGRRLILYIGSSIGNFDPGEAAALLRRVRAQLLPGDGLLLGVDMVKEVEPLLAAYNDADGVTAAFNKNVLLRINRELGANFQPCCFHHKALWSPRQSRVEMHLESLVAHEVSIAALGLEVCFAQGETIHTENSYKFTNERVSMLLEQAGFAIRQQWSDPRNWFGVYLAVAH